MHLAYTRILTTDKSKILNGTECHFVLRVVGEETVTHYVRQVLSSEFKRSAGYMRESTCDVTAMLIRLFEQTAAGISHCNKPESDLAPG